MARVPDSPVRPRISAPDLPVVLTDSAGFATDGDSFQLRITAPDADTAAAHAEVSECRIEPASVDTLDLTGASVIDVTVDDLRATSVNARGARLRRVRVTGGRLGTLDLSNADIDEVELVGVRINYLTLAHARAQDVRIVDCTIGTFDLPQMTATRFAVDDTTADEVDTRGLRAKHTDFRGLDAGTISDAAALRGVTLTHLQVERLAPALAVALGIDLSA